MKGDFRVRTDLALEAREVYGADGGKIRGVRIEEEKDEERELYVTTVMIETENAAKAMGKPVGTYITLEAPNLSDADEGYHQEISAELAERLHGLIGAEKKEILVVGLGNREVTPDALGPGVVGNLFITRHLIREFGQIPAGSENGYPDSEYSISAIVPGVMAQTGMETQEIISGIVHETAPEVIIVIDALAARNTKRLNRTIQITDTGISPGSGVGNYRHAMNEEVLGIPVIAIGVPTVVDAATIVNDTIENLIRTMEQSESEETESYTRAEQYQTLKRFISPQLNTMFVTPKDIDETIKRLSFTISEGLNMLFEKRPS